MLRLYTFGGLYLRGGSPDEVEALQARKKGMALLVYLAVQGGDRRVSREEIASLLWPDRTDARARNALRTTLSRIRQSAAPSPLGGKGQPHLWIRGDCLESDHRAFRRAVESEAWGEALEIYQGPFLSGFRVSDAPEFERWVDVRRMEFERTACRSALALGNDARDEGDLATAEAGYRRALELAPLQEEPLEELLSVLVEQGRRSEAVRLFEDFVSRLDEDLQLSPSESLLEKIGSVHEKAGGGRADRSGDSRPRGDSDDTDRTVGGPAPEVPPDSGPNEEAPRPARSPRPGHRWIKALLVALFGAVWLSAADSGPSTTSSPAVSAESGDRPLPPVVAVLPFEHIGPPSSAPFTHGMHDEVINQVAKISSLRVLSRTSVQRYGGTDRSPSEMSEELGGVDAFLEGTVRRAGDRVRMAVQLVDPGRGTTLWAETFEREESTGALFAIQTEIATEIARSLGRELLSEERDRIAVAPTPDLEAYDLYLEGRRLAWSQRTLGSGVSKNDTAVALLRAAVRRDPEFAPALAWLGIAYGSRFAATRESRWRDSAFAAARRARALRPDLAVAHAAEAFAHWLTGTRGEENGFRRAAERAREAVALQPSLALGTGMMVAVHDWLGNHTEVLRWAHRGATLRPNEPTYLSLMGFALFRLGFLDAAETWVRRALTVDPDHWGSVRVLSEIEAEREGPGAGASRTAEYIDRHPTARDAYLSAARYHAELGEYREAERLYLEADAMRSTDGLASADGGVTLPEYDMALLGHITARLGDPERGRELMRRAIREFRERELDGPFALESLAEMNAGLGARTEAVRYLKLAISKGYFIPLDGPLWETVERERTFVELQGQIRANRQALREEARNILPASAFPTEGDRRTPDEDSSEAGD